jgi:OOP family OmpA-OmpF porin
MINHNKLHNIILGLALVCATTTAYSTDVGKGYISGYIGSTNIEDDGFDDSDTSFRIGGGYKFNKNFALEGYYIDYGTTSDSGFTADADGLQVQGVGLLPVSKNVDIYGKLGLVMWDAELCLSGFGCMNDDGNDFVFGFGGSFALSKQVDLRAEYEIADFDGTDVTTLMVGVNFAF